MHSEWGFMSAKKQNKGIKTLYFEEKWFALVFLAVAA